MPHNAEYLGREGYLLMGTAFEVYRELGHGRAEEIYQESLELELRARSIEFSSKAEINTYYKGQLLQKKYVPDLRVFGEIVTELKASKELLPEHESQLINYMRIAKKAVGYLINFGPSGGVEWKRFILNEFVPKR